MHVFQRSWSQLEGEDPSEIYAFFVNCMGLIYLNVVVNGREVN